MGFSADDYAAAGRTPNLMAEAIMKRSEAKRKNDYQAEKEQRDIKNLQDLIIAHPKQGVHSGEFSVTSPDNSSELLRAMQIKNLQDERDRKAIQDVEDRSVKAGTAQALPALQRGEEAIPGLFTGGQPKLKSVGGIKNLAPDFAVPALEKMGIMDKGASKERTALQELQNAKIYDSSGKQINESEMARIKSALGLKGVFSSEEILPALQQMGYTVQAKQKQVTAGAEPDALKTFKGRGGLAGYQSLPELIGAPTGMQPKERVPVKTMRNKKTGQVKTIFSDGSEEVK